MDLRRTVASVLAVASVYVLVGLGWALGAAAILVFISPEMKVERAKAFISAIGSKLRSGWSRLHALPQPVARMFMGVALVSIGVGVSLAVHPGWGIAAVGMGIGALSLVADMAG